VNEKNATVDAALALHGYESEKQESDKVRPSFPQGPLIPPACRPLLERDAREAALADLAPDLPGQRYDEARDTDLPEFVVLHLGCGRKQRLEQLPPITCFTAAGDEVRPPIRLVNLDGMAHAGAHLTATLGADAIALPDDSVDLMIASHVLEHIGRQGELAGWFQFWGEVYRVLKSGGRLQFLSPYYTSQWCWGDPTHSRAIGEFCFLYLNQDSYRIPAEQTAIPDYRPPCDLQLLRWRLVADTDTQTRQREGRSHIEGVLVARKPFRPYWEDAR
jgi:hypothetical protein